MVQKIIIGILLSFIALFSFSSSAIAAKPKIDYLSAYTKELKGGAKKIYVTFSVSNNTNSIRVVYCPKTISKKPIKCKGRSKVFVPKRLKCKPAVPRCNWWGANFRARGTGFLGYVVARNSDGATKRLWAAT